MTAKSLVITILICYVCPAKAIVDDEIYYTDTVYSKSEKYRLTYIFDERKNQKDNNIDVSKDRFGEPNYNSDYSGVFYIDKMNKDGNYYEENRFIVPPSFRIDDNHTMNFVIANNASYVFVENILNERLLGYVSQMYIFKIVEGDLIPYEPNLQNRLRLYGSKSFIFLEVFNIDFGDHMKFVQDYQDVYMRGNDDSKFYLKILYRKNKIVFKTKYYISLMDKYVRKKQRVGLCL